MSIKPSLLILFFSFNFTFSLENQCYVCHNTSPMWFLQRAQQIKSLQKANLQKDRIGHVWLKSQDIMRVVTKLKPVKKQIVKSFYLQLKNAIENKNKNAILELIEIGKKEVPKFEIIWNKLLLHTNAEEFDHSGFKQAYKSLLYPYYYLNLDIQKNARYEATSKINLKKVFLIFGGFRNTITSILSASFSNQLNILDVKGSTSKKYEFEGIYEYKLDDFGVLKSFKNNTNVSNTYLKNLSSAFARPSHQNFEQFTGVKRVYMTPSKFFKKDHLDLQITFNFDQLISDNELPLLKLNFTMKELAKDRKDSLQVYGKGSVLLFPWGVVKDFKTHVKFKFKALGFNLFRGQVQEQLKYIQ